MYLLTHLILLFIKNCMYQFCIYLYSTSKRTCIHPHSEYLDYSGVYSASNKNEYQKQNNNVSGE
jgi:hypothetical protein